MVYDEKFYESELVRSLLPPKKLAKKVIIPSSDKEAYQRLYEIGSNILSFVSEGNNLMIWSNEVGTGKTLMATKLAEQYILKRNEKNRATDCALFINVGDLLFYKKDSFNNVVSQKMIWDLEEKIKDCKLVVWDDIGTKGMSEFDKEYLIVLLNHRLNDLHKSNIYTTNLNENQLREVIGVRLASRLREDTEIIELKGGDKR